jgi:DNA-directed RNA polymerase subunit RPC12/RpoP
MEADMAVCKCGKQMELKKEKIDDTYRIIWVCPDCGRRQQLAPRPKGKK